MRTAVSLTRRQRTLGALCLVIFTGISPELDAQVCRLSVAGLNQSRRVAGPVSAECPAPLHTAPFGNWGVTSNFGPKLDGHQFDGWCHNTQICDNLSVCRTECRDGWYEWNSCTDHFLFRPPNCTLYNANDCTEQVSTTGINVLGTQTVDLPVSCPVDVDGDGTADGGGCSDIKSYSHGTNYMSIYELDPGTADELVQTLYFPQTLVNTNCGVWNCPPAGSQWVAPSAYDNPPSPPKVYAELATVVNSGIFLDQGGSCRGVVSFAASVSAASYTGPGIAPGSIASAFGRGLAGVTREATAIPLPTLLAGITVGVKDSSGTERLAPLFFVSPNQINYLVPEATSLGPAAITVRDGAQIVATGTLQPVPVAPGLFSANASGQGVAAALAVRVAADGSQTFLQVFQCEPVAGSCSATPVDLGTGNEQTFLILFGTGIRGRSSLSAVKASIGGTDAEVQYAGSQNSLIGLDQVNIRIPGGLRGRGEVDVVLAVDGVISNTVTVKLK
jgi:uncharacterized protein (TIGR03437 family)